MSVALLILALALLVTLPGLFPWAKQWGYSPVLIVVAALAVLVIVATCTNLQPPPLLLP